MKLRFSNGKLQSFEEFYKYKELISGFEKVREWVDVPDEDNSPIEIPSIEIEVGIIYNVSQFSHQEHQFNYLSSHKNVDYAIEAAKKYSKNYKKELCDFSIMRIELT